MTGLSRFRRLLALAACSFVALACGGGAKEPETAADAEAAADSEASDGADSESSPDGDETASAAEHDPCADGTCTPCGSGHCPTGWYCDEGARGGPACGWVPECTKKPSCACIQRALGEKCEERAGGFYLTSD